jgi:ribose transport system ATP-binding protein
VHSGVRTAPAVSRTAGTETTPLLEVRSISRAFGPVQALKDASFAVRRGEVVGLIGENGAGKSTLLNIVSGTDRPDAGQVLIRGEVAAYRSYNDATRGGVFRVFQELALIPNLTVWENLFLGHEEHFLRARTIDRRAAIRRAREMMDRFGHGWIDVERPMGEYGFAVQQLLEILKAFTLAELLGYSEPVVLLDEPTTSLASDEVEFLHGLIETVREHSAMVFVSHRLPELLAWSDRVVVMKDGQVVGEGDAATMTEDELHLMMVGRERMELFYREDRQREPEPDVVLEVAGLSDGVAFRDVDLAVRRGEIVGVAGVIGSGKSELGRTVFGADAVVEGTIRYRGAELRRPSTRAMVRMGVGYVSAERKVDGIVDTFSVTQNITFAELATRAEPLVGIRRERRQGRSYVDRLRIKTASPRSSILSLSGGNQQKALIARWLAAGVELLILDNPTRGVDAGAKEEIYDLMRDLARDGVAILLISDDLLEVTGLSNRVVVMKGGVVTGVMDAPPEAKPGEAELIAKMV